MNALLWDFKTKAEWYKRYIKALPGLCVRLLFLTEEDKRASTEFWGPVIVCVAGGPWAGAWGGRQHGGCWVPCPWAMNKGGLTSGPPQNTRELKNQFWEQAKKLKESKQRQRWKEGGTCVWLAEETPLTVSVRWHSVGLLLRGAGELGGWQSPPANSMSGSDHALETEAACPVHILWRAALTWRARPWCMICMYHMWCVCGRESSLSDTSQSTPPDEKTSSPSHNHGYSNRIFIGGTESLDCVHLDLWYLLLFKSKLQNCLIFFGHCAGILNERDQSKEHWVLFRVGSSVQLWRVPLGKFRLLSISLSIASKAFCSSDSYWEHFIFDLVIAAFYGLFSVRWNLFKEEGLASSFGLLPCAVPGTEHSLLRLPGQWIPDPRPLQIPAELRVLAFSVPLPVYPAPLCFHGNKAGALLEGCGSWGGPRNGNLHRAESRWLFCPFFIFSKLKFLLW